MVKVQKKKRVVFTNGCFDILHYGHLHLLREARKLGDRLIVGINSDASVKRLKGNSRPIFECKYRKQMLTSLIFVDGVVEFDEDTPLEIIKKVQMELWSLMKIRH
jgi:D-beta-D-heptose 7-phosphate kinase/D-beta-D-heptose 1-phosphate adenosyltransferase